METRIKTLCGKLELFDRLRRGHQGHPEGERQRLQHHLERLLHRQVERPEADRHDQQPDQVSQPSMKSGAYLYFLLHS